MYRTVMEQLQKWKAKKHRKPLVIRGARQVGKTWIMKAFGAAEYESVVYINFDNNERMRNLFERNLAVERLVTGLELYAGHKIDPAKSNHLCREPFGRGTASRNLFPSWKSRVS